MSFLDTCASSMETPAEKHESSHPNETSESGTQAQQRSNDIEKQDVTDSTAPTQSAFKSLGWLDRLLALWILLAMVTGILLGNFVDSVGPALKSGEFVGVSIPIGERKILLSSLQRVTSANTSNSNRTPRHDVSHSLQGQV